MLVSGVRLTPAASPHQYWGATQVYGGGGGLYSSELPGSLEGIKSPCITIIILLIWEINY